MKEICCNIHPSTRMKTISSRQIDGRMDVEDDVHRELNGYKKKKVKGKAHGG